VRGAGPTPLSGQTGRPGLVKLLVGTLRARRGALPIDGPLTLGRPVPSDPVPPSTVGGAHYSAGTGHNLSDPILSTWRRFGAPRSEPFLDGGHRVQYPERATFAVSDGRVILVPVVATCLMQTI